MSSWIYNSSSQTWNRCSILLIEVLHVFLIGQRSNDDNQLIAESKLKFYTFNISKLEFYMQNYVIVDL